MRLALYASFARMPRPVLHARARIADAGGQCSAGRCHQAVANSTTSRTSERGQYVVTVAEADIDAAAAELRRRGVAVEGPDGHDVEL